MTLKNKIAPLLCYFKLCASFHGHKSFQAGVRVRKPKIRVKIGHFLSRLTLKFDRWPWNTIEHLFYAASGCVHDFMWIQTGVRVRKRLSWVLTSVTLTFDFWPWPLAWTTLLPMVITPDNFMMIRWWEHGENGVTDGRTDRQTDRRTDWTSHITAWSQLKMADCLAGFALHIFLFSNQMIVVHFIMNSICFNSYQLPAFGLFSGRNTHVDKRLTSLITYHLNTTWINEFMLGIMMRASWKQLPSASLQLRSMLHEIYFMTCCNGIVGDHKLTLIYKVPLSYFD